MKQSVGHFACNTPNTKRKTEILEMTKKKGFLIKKSTNLRCISPPQSTESALPDPAIIPGVEAIENVAVIVNVPREMDPAVKEVADGTEDVLYQLGGIEDTDDVVRQPRQRASLGGSASGGYFFIRLDDIFERWVPVLPDFVLHDQADRRQDRNGYYGKDDVIDVVGDLRAQVHRVLCRQFHRFGHFIRFTYYGQGPAVHSVDGQRGQQRPVKPHR